MEANFLTYLFSELKEHMQRLKDLAYAEDPDGDGLEYHHDKAEKIVCMIEEATMISNTSNTVRIIGGSRSAAIRE